MIIIEDNKPGKNLNCEFCGFPGIGEPDEFDNIKYYWIYDESENIIIDGPFCSKTCAKDFKKLMEKD